MFSNEDHLYIRDEVIDVMKTTKDIIASDPNSTDEPFYIFNIDDIVKKHQLWFNNMPMIAPHYAVKCNDNDVVLKILASLGTSFDCASKTEISKILNLGVPSDKIIFANPTKPSSHIRFAAENGVKTMTFDCDIELQKIKMIMPDANLVLRIRCEAKDAQCPLGKKFGCDPDLEAVKLLKFAKKMKMQVVGISFHVGSGCRDYPIYSKAIKICKHLFNEAKKLGFNLNLLDIGGGFPGDMDKLDDFIQIADIINTSLDKEFPLKNVRVIAEPGRFFVSSAFTLITNVHSKKNIYNPQNGDVKHVMYYINDGVYGSFNSLIYDHQIVKPIILKDNIIDINSCNSSIWGPTCDSLDCIIESIPLPNIDVGDFIMFENMGAYTIPVASPFNGFPLPKIFYFISENVYQLLSNSNPLKTHNENVLASENITHQVLVA